MRVRRIADSRRRVHNGRMQAVVRPASILDIGAMHQVRLSVQENKLSEGAGIKEESYLRFVQTGSAWVAEIEKQVIGFAAIDAVAMSVWALFVSPHAEKLGVGRVLHDCMIDWARDRGFPQLSLSTAPGTRAQGFYTAAGWQAAGVSGTGEMCFRRQLRP